MDHNEEPLGQAEDARVTRQGRYSAWLKKAKSENARCKLIQSHNTRYFTIDFDSQIIFYSHSTSQKKVSQPIPFRDFLGAERLPLPTKCRRSKTAMIFGFILKTKPRTFELFTNSSTDAAQWTFSLNAAMEMGKLKCLEQLKVLQGQQAEVRNQDEGAQIRTAPQTAAVSEDEKEASRLKQERPGTEVQQEMAQAAATARKEQEEEAARQKQEEEAAAKKKQEEEEAAAKRKQEEEEAAARKKQEEDAAAKRKQEEEEAAARRKQEAEAAARKKQEEEALARQTEADAARKEAASPEGEPSIEAVEDLSDVKVGVQDLLQDAFEQGVLVEALAIFLAQDVHDDAGDASEWKEMMRLEDMQKAKSKKSEGKHEKREKKRQKEEANQANQGNQANQANQELVPAEGRPTEELPPLKPRMKLAPLVAPAGAEG